MTKEKEEIDEEIRTSPIEIKSESDVYDLIFREDDITWQAVILELARTGKINPWDIDVSVLAQEYLKTIKKLKEMNFRLSGKVILAGAILLKLKAERLGVAQLLALINPEQYAIPEGEEDIFDFEKEKRFTKADLHLALPRIRKRKVSVFELVEALKKAIDVDIKRAERLMAWKKQPIRPLPDVQKPDIFEKIEVVFLRIKKFVKQFKKTTIKFEEIVPSKNKKDIIWTLIPLLHLAMQDKLSLRQKEPFGQIYVDIRESALKEKLEKSLFFKEEKKEKKVGGKKGKKTRK